MMISKPQQDSGETDLLANAPPPIVGFALRTPMTPTAWLVSTTALSTTTTTTTMTTAFRPTAAASRLECAPRRAQRRLDGRMSRRKLKSCQPAAHWTTCAMPAFDAERAGEQLSRHAWRAVCWMRMERAAAQSPRLRIWMRCCLAEAFSSFDDWHD